MKKKMISKLCALLFATIVACSPTAHGQSSYWSIPGYQSIDAHPLIQRLNASAAPGTLLAEHEVVDLSNATGSIAGKTYITSAYDNAGALLFTANSSGIFDKDGNEVYSFAGSSPVFFSDASTTDPDYAMFGYDYLNPQYAVSEISIFPCTTQPGNTSYYCVFWAKDESSGTGSGTTPNYSDLRVVKVDVDPAGLAAVASDGSGDHVLRDASWSYGRVVTDQDNPLAFGISADKAGCGTSRDVYSIEENAYTDIYGTYNYATYVRKWVFAADGTLPTAPTTMPNTYAPMYSGKSKIVTIGTTKYLAYVGSHLETNISGVITGPKISLVDISGSIGTYSEHLIDMVNRRYIYGFEYVPSQHGFYVSYQTKTPGLSSTYVAAKCGIGFFDLSSGGAFTEANNTAAYSRSDLELDSHPDVNGVGDLYMVNGGAGTATDGSDIGGSFFYATDGSLAYLPVNAAGYLPPTATSPTLPTGLTTRISVTNYQGTVDASIKPYYLTKQIKGEDLTYPTITGIDIDTRCAPGHGDVGVPNPHYYVQTTGGVAPLSYVWTPKPSYLVFPSSGPTQIYINNNVALSPAFPTNTNNPEITSVIPALFPNTIEPDKPTADFYLTVTGANGCAAKMEVKTVLLTSGWDLVTKDNPFDLYDEPGDEAMNPGNWDIWHSPDIANHHYSFETDTINQPAVFNDDGGLPHPNYLNVRVRNVGCTASLIATLNTFWTLGHLGSETWPGDWRTNTYTSPSCSTATSQPLGLALPEVTMPSIPVCSNHTFQVTWTPPDPSLYYPSSCGLTVPDNVELCFLSIVTVPDFIETTFSFVPYITADVLNNNNTSTYNTSVADVTPYPTTRHGLFVSNTGIIKQNFSLEFANSYSIFKGTGVSQLSKFVSIKLYLGHVFDIWQAAGARGSYTSINQAEKSVTFDGSRTVRLDSVVLDTGSVYPITAEFILNKGVDGSQMPTEQVSFRQLRFNNAIDTLVDTLHVTYVDTIINPTTHVVTYDTMHAYALDTTYKPRDTVDGNYNFIVQYKAPTKGVLAVTEMSNGPSGDCEYAEMVVANCSDDMTPTVDVSGWIMDDNSGNFDTGGCITNTGIAQGHYRLAYDGTWGSVPVGSVIVMYNHDANCYDLSDTFRVDTTATGLVYWLPIGGTVAAPYGNPHVERFGTHPSITDCGYCADTGVTAYTAAAAWSNTIGLNNTEDAFQVRCPGCSVASPGSPSFYHGIGYGPATGVDAYATIPAGTGNIGGPVKTGNGTAKKFVFTGSTMTDLGDPTKWTSSTADAAGAAPPTLGNVNSDLMTQITTHMLDLPCCGATANTGRKAHTAATPAAINDAATGIRVYPNPATATVYFEFPASEKVTIKMFDISGRVTAQQVVSNGTTASFDVSNYAPGIYLYQVVSSDEAKSGKIIIGK